MLFTHCFAREECLDREDEESFEGYDHVSCSWASNDNIKWSQFNRNRII